MATLKETRYFDATGTALWYFADKDVYGKHPIKITYKQARDEDFFKEAATDENSPYYKGDLAKFSFEHNIGLHFQKEEDFAFWISDESHYVRDKFFYIDNFRGQKTTAFQLRVSNHPTIHSQWENMHAGHSDVRAEFCLTLLINPYNRDNEPPEPSKKVPVTSLTCDISDYYHGMPAERVAAIDKFVDAVVAGEQPHITMDDIRFMGGGEPPKESDSGPQGVEHGIHNFDIRPNLNLYGKNFAFTKKQEAEVSSEIATSIPYSRVENLKDGDFFDYKGRQYQFHIGDEFYANPVKHKKKTEYVDEKTKIIIERIVKIGKQDLMEMVKQCLKCLL